MKSIKRQSDKRQTRDEPSKVSASQARESISSRAKRFDWHTVDDILARVPANPPLPGDEKVICYREWVMVAFKSRRSSLIRISAFSFPSFPPLPSGKLLFSRFDSLDTSTPVQ